MSVSNLFPSIRPTLGMDFVKSRLLHPGVTFTRASSASVVGPNGFIQTVGSGVPRFDFDPVTGECLGLLLEEFTTNLAFWSETFNDASWAGGGLTVSANVTTAPDGTQTADKLVETSATEQHLKVQAITTTAAAHTFSAYVKTAEWTTFQFQMGNGGPLGTFNLSNGTATTALGATSATIRPAGNGWFRCAVTGTMTAGATAFYIYKNGTVYLGDGASGIFVWGAQVEANPVPTSYIATTNQQITRQGDSAIMSGEAFSSWYRPDEGTLLCEGLTNQAAVDRALWTISDGTNNNRLTVSTGGNNTVWNPFVIHNGVSQGASTVSANPKTVPRVAFAYKNNDYIASAGGLLGANDTVNTIPLVNQLVLGGEGNGANRLNSHIRRLYYWNQRLPNATLQVLTS
jgi:hypothetical protein